MKDDRLLLGIDIGTSSSKGVLVSLDGQLIAEQSVPHGFDIPQPGWAEQTPTPSGGMTFARYLAD